MNWSFWSDEERWFVPRRFGLGLTFNFKQLARRLGWVQRPAVASQETGVDAAEAAKPADAAARLRERIEASKYEERR